MYFMVLNEEQAQVYAFEQPHVNISIRTPGSPKPELSPLATGRRASLFLEFHDVTDPALDGKALSELLGHPVQGNIKCFTPEQAKQIIEFYNEWKDSVGLVVVNCVAGISRSAGTAAALSVIAGQGDEFIFKNKRYHPNMLVYRLLLNEAFGNVQKN